LIHDSKFKVANEEPELNSTVVFCSRLQHFRTENCRWQSTYFWSTQRVVRRVCAKVYCVTTR